MILCDGIHVSISNSESIGHKVQQYTWRRFIMSFVPDPKNQIPVVTIIHDLVAIKMLKGPSCIPLLATFLVLYFLFVCFLSRFCSYYTIANFRDNFISVSFLGINQYLYVDSCLRV